MQISDLKRIVMEQGGSLSPDDLDLLAQNMPDILVGIKYGYGPRTGVIAKYAKDEIKRNVDGYKYEGVDQYVREVFIVVSEMDKIRDLFKWPQLHVI